MGKGAAVVGSALQPPAHFRLEDMLSQLTGLPREQREAIEQQVLSETAGIRWVPNPGPQTDAYYSEADELYYGGEAGGGKSDLALGLALNEHKRSVIFREFKEHARDLGERLVQIVGSTDGWRASPPRYKSGNRIIEFDGLPNEEDKQHHKGRARDLIAFDELPDFYESQYLFITAWNRSSDPKQRCRIVCTGNPPTRSKGLWVIKRWAAWLDPRHPRPAKDGELRWYLRAADGNEIEVDGPGPHRIDGEPKPVRAKSRTFIRARLEDNPDLARTDYDATLANLPKELRDAYRAGKFDAALKDHPFQLIPTAWVLESQKRWTPQPPAGVPMCGMGVDPAQGGKDRMTIAKRHDGWYAPFFCVPGNEIKLGSEIAGHVIAHRRDRADIVLDMGGGYGSSAHDRLLENGVQVKVYKGANKSYARTSDGKLGFVNKRTEVYWKFREALDPDQVGGSPIALPPDPEIVGDLTAVTYEVTPHGIKALEKEQVCKLLGRSPDKADAAVMAWSSGARGFVPDGMYGREQRVTPQRTAKAMPKVDMGPRHRNRR